MGTGITLLLLMDKVKLMRKLLNGTNNEQSMHLIKILLFHKESIKCYFVANRFSYMTVNSGWLATKGMFSNCYIGHVF